MKQKIKATHLVIPIILALAVIACRLPFARSERISQSSQTSTQPVIIYNTPTTSADPIQVPAANDVLVLIYSLDQNSPLLSAYGYNLEQSEIGLPAGDYYAEVLKGDGQFLAFAPLIVENELAGFGRVNFTDQPAVQLNPQVSLNEFLTLFQFMLGVEHTRMTFFKIVSDNFQEPLFTPGFHAGWPEEQKLAEAFDRLGHDGTVLVAAQAFLNRAEMAAERQPGQKILASIPGQGLVEAVFNFFSVAREDNLKAREDILLIYDHMTPQDKEEAFETIQYTLPPNELAGLGNYDDFIEKVKSNQIANMRAVRRDLAQQGPLSGIFQTIIPDMNRPGLEIIHRVGVTAIERGAELYVEVNKNILSVSFPGIDTGFDYADQAEEWINYIHDTYQNPMGAIEGAVWDQFEDKVGSQIKDSILARFPDTPEDIAEELAGRIVGEMKTTLVSMGESLQNFITNSEPGEDQVEEVVLQTPADIYTGFVTSQSNAIQVTNSEVEIIVADERVLITLEFTFKADVDWDADNNVICTATMTRFYQGETKLNSPIEVSLSLIDHQDVFLGSDCSDASAPVIREQNLVGGFFEDGSFQGNIRNIWSIFALLVEE